MSLHSYNANPILCLRPPGRIFLTFSPIHDLSQIYNTILGLIDPVHRNSNGMSRVALSLIAMLFANSDNISLPDSSPTSLRCPTPHHVFYPHPSRSQMSVLGASHDGSRYRLNPSVKQKRAVVVKTNRFIRHTPPMDATILSVIANLSRAKCWSRAPRVSGSFKESEFGSITPQSLRPLKSTFRRPVPRPAGLQGLLLQWPPR